MEKEFVPYEQALQLKELGFDEQFHCFGEYRQWNGSVPYLKLYQDVDGCSTDPADYEYTSDCIAPTFSQAFRWFREKYNLHYRITYYDPVKAQELNHADYQGGIYASAASWFDGSLYIPHDSFWKLENSPYDTYEEAELACLKKLIEIVKEK